MLRSQVKLSRKLTVGPQPSEDELETLAGKGYSAIVNLSKKGELDQEIDPEDEAKMVKSLKMKYLHLPVSLSSVKHHDVDKFIEFASSLDGAVYVHCRIGQRAVPFGLILHALRKKMDFQQLLTRASKLGLDWDAPFISSFIESYLRKQQAA